MFGIPLQQKWDYFESGPRAPDYYLLSDAELYYYSFTDAIIADQYLHLPAAGSRADRSHDHRVQSDGHVRGRSHPQGAADVSGRVLRHRRIFRPQGIRFLESRGPHGEPARIRRWTRVLTFAGEVGLVVILHNDINTVRPAPGRPAHFDDLKTVFRAHKGTSIIWAHTGLGRFVKPTADHVDLLREILASDEFSHVSFDISWDEVAKWIVADDATLDAWVKLLKQYPDRFLFGSDAVAPKTQADYLKAFDAYQSLWERLDAETASKVKSQNFERIFDAARKKVRAWEAKQIEK